MNRESGGCVCVWGVFSSGRYNSIQSECSRSLTQRVQMSVPLSPPMHSGCALRACTPSKRSKSALRQRSTLSRLRFGRKLVQLALLSAEKLAGGILVGSGQLERSVCPVCSPGARAPSSCPYCMSGVSAPSVYLSVCPERRGRKYSPECVCLMSARSPETHRL